VRAFALIVFVVGVLIPATGSARRVPTAASVDEYTETRVDVHTGATDLANALRARASPLAAGGGGTVLGLAERAADLQKRLPSGNRASIPHQGGRLNVDLAGKSHHVKGVGEVPTPHVVEFKNNIIPAGPRAGQVGSRSQIGPTRPATASDLRIVDRWLTSLGF